MHLAMLRSVRCMRRGPGGGRLQLGRGGDRERVRDELVALSATNSSNPSRGARMQDLTLCQRAPHQLRVRLHLARKTLEVVRVELLGPVAERYLRILSHLDDDPVGPHRRGRP